MLVKNELPGGEAYHRTQKPKHYLITHSFPYLHPGNRLPRCIYQTAAIKCCSLTLLKKQYGIWLYPNI